MLRSSSTQIARPTFAHDLTERIKTRLCLTVNPSTGDYRWSTNDGMLYSWGIEFSADEKNEEVIATALLENYAYSVLDAKFGNDSMNEIILIGGKRVCVGDLFEENDSSRRLVYLFGTKSVATKNVKALAKVLATERKRIVKEMTKLKSDSPLSADALYTVVARTEGGLELLLGRVIIGTKHSLV